MLMPSEKRAQGFKNKVGAFNLGHHFLKEIIFDCYSDLSTIPQSGGGFSILYSLVTTQSNELFLS